MTAWMIIALLGLTVSLPFFESDDQDTGEDDIPETPEAGTGDTVDGTLGDDSLFAGEDETLNGLEGNDTLASVVPNTLLNGGAGDDVLSLSGGTGTANGDAGADTLTLEGSTDPAAPSTFSADGGIGDDTISGSGFGGTIAGGDGADQITVEGGFDTITGGAGTDTITLTEAATSDNTQTVVDGGEGDDRISTQVVASSAGVTVTDLLSGGTGADVFEMTFRDAGIDPEAQNALGTIAQITDFDATEDQLVIDLSGLGDLGQNANIETDLDFIVTERPDGSGSDVIFTLNDTQADTGLTGSIALDGALGINQEDVSLVFTGGAADA